MSRTLRRALASAIATAALLAGALASPPPASAVSTHPAGVVGPTVTLGGFPLLPAYDVAAAPDGTAYIGWISTTLADSARRVHLCTLRIGASSCTGGVQTIDGLDSSSPAGLRVLLDGHGVVHLVWFHDTANSINGPSGAAIAEATAPGGQGLTAGHDVITDAPSFGQLLDVERGPGGEFWTVSYAGVPTRSVQVRAGYGGPAVSVPTPFAVGYAQLAFSGSRPVLTVEKYGAISTPPYYAYRGTSGAWTGFHAVAHTWAVGTNAALAATRHGLRIVTAVNDASYRPVVARWLGTGFSAPSLTADRNACAPSTHDGWADASGRLLDVSWECNRVTIANYPDASAAAITRFSVGSTPTMAPQIASGTRGIATVVYSTEPSSGGTGIGHVLRVVHVRLPDATRSVRASGRAGRVTVTGPRSCLPPVNVAIGWSHHPAKGWRYHSGSLRLAGHAVSSLIDGARLNPGRSYALTGTATFTRSGSSRTVRATLGFTTCATR